MKKINLAIISIIIFLININVVFAKDTVYSLNKYKEEKFTLIKDSYNASGTKDGLIIAGNILKETIKDEKNDEEYNDYQAILVKYNKDGKVKWTFTYGKNKEDTVDYLDYTYDEDNKVDGYLIAMEKTYDSISTETTNEELVNKNQTTYIKVGLDGKLVWEKDTNLNINEKIIKILKTHDEENKFNGYIAIGNTKESSIILKYDKEFNIIWQKEYKNADYSKIENIDITIVEEKNKIINYVVIRKLTKDKENAYEIIKYDLDGNEVKNIPNENISNLSDLKLERADNGFILYGITSEVKLKKGQNSYFLIKYNKEDEEEWELIGTRAIDDKKKIVLMPINSKDTIKSYFLMYNNKSDSSNEIVKISPEGTLEKKVKKIKNDYYDFENFYTINDVLYFIGQINCPEDDNCEYDSNSLFLISDEDKVIEVEEESNTSIIIIISVITVLLIIVSILRKKRRLQN